MTHREKVRALRKHKRILQHFCESSSIHGLRHVYEDGSLMFERYGTTSGLHFFARWILFLKCFPIFWKGCMDLLVSLWRLFFNLFLRGSMAKVGTVTYTHIRWNSTVPIEKRPLSSSHNLQCQQSVWKQALRSNIRQPKVRSLTLLLAGSLRKLH
jgi:hypothetical protein